MQNYYPLEVLFSYKRRHRRWFNENGLYSSGQHRKYTLMNLGILLAPKKIHLKDENALNSSKNIHYTIPLWYGEGELQSGDTVLRFIYYIFNSSITDLLFKFSSKPPCCNVFEMNFPFIFSIFVYEGCVLSCK